MTCGRNMDPAQMLILGIGTDTSIYYCSHTRLEDSDVLNRMQVQVVYKCL